MTFYANIRRKEIKFCTFSPCRIPESHRDDEEDTEERQADQDKITAVFQLEEPPSLVSNKD